MDRFRFSMEANAEEETIGGYLQAISPLEEQYFLSAREHNDSLCKPLGSLGLLEDIRERLWAITQGENRPFKKGVIVFAGDNGVWTEGISGNPQDTTYKVCLNILSGRSGLGRIAAYYGVEVFLQDVAVLEDVAGHTEYKIRKGTGNIAKGPAMTRAEAAGFILSGMESTFRLIDEGFDLIGAGEMGVGNTTTSAAVISVLTGKDPQCATGYGSGLTQAGLNHKTRIVEEAIAANQPYGDVLDVLTKLAGGDIIAMAGSYLACASRHIPFVLDGVISMAAFAAAYEFSPLVRQYAFPSHTSMEHGAALVMEKYGLKAMLDLEMRLGEGAGCPMAMDLMECAVHTLDSMASFQDVSVNKSDYIDIREDLKHEKIDEDSGSTASCGHTVRMPDRWNGDNDRRRN